MDIAGIITALGVIIVAWFQWTKERKDKKAGAELDMWRKNQERKAARDSEHVAQIYGILWELMYKLQSERVYIIQPHPLAHHQFISISMEVVKRGTSSMRSSIYLLPMSEAPRFVGLISTESWVYRKVAEFDSHIQAVMGIGGTTSLAIKKMIGSEDEWVGSLVTDTTTDKVMDDDVLHQSMRDAANQIQYILPEYKS
ncbi:MAG: hypothetical protein LBS09_07210 [Bacteroidales bacterium]|jgi:hypothetical protein|nr:hypothetical protein [Bacteroidales bacterium]